MRVVSWNVNGIRAGVRHGFVGFVDRSAADIVGVQEVRAQPEDIPPAARRPPGWHTAFTVAERRGYSGVGLYSKLQPVRVDTSLGVPRFDREGRFMAGHFQTTRGRFVVVNSYFPKGSGPARDNSRVGYKLDFSRTVFARAQELRRRGPVLVIGDYNTAHRAIDLVLSKNPIDAVRRADSTLDARRVATFVTAESLCSARPVCRLFPKCCSSSSWPSRAGSTRSSVTSLTLSRKRIASAESSSVLAGSGSPTPSAGAWPHRPSASGDGYAVTCTPWSRPIPSSAGIDR